MCYLRQKTAISGFCLNVVISSAPHEELEPLLASGNVDAIVHKGDLHTGLVQQLRKLLSGRPSPGPLPSRPAT